MIRHWRRFLLLAAFLLLLVGLSLLPGVFQERAGEDPVPPETGLVRSVSGAPPPAGVRIEAWGDALLGEARIDASGAFRLPELPERPGEYRVLWKGGYGRVPAGRGPVEILLPDSAGEGVGGNEEDPPEVISVGGVLVDAVREEPVAGAEVRLGERSATSDERGRFSLGEIPAPEAGDPPLTVLAKGYRVLYVLPPGLETWDDLYLRLTRR